VRRNDLPQRSDKSGDFLQSFAKADNSAPILTRPPSQNAASIKIF
jgi:hypothetical protein